MIIARAPLRISFVGGGTDLPDFYRQYPGRVFSVAIDKFTYVIANHIPHAKKIIVKYTQTEVVDNLDDLKHTRIREALRDLGIDKNIEIASFADISSKSGLGSSSTFSVALLKALNSYLGNSLSKQDIAEAASRLEIDILKEPIGKQDQYAAAFGGFNVFQFNSDESVDVKPVNILHKTKNDFQKHLILFFTGTTRDASSVLTEQKSNIADKMEVLKNMSDSVFKFEELILKGDFEQAGKMLDEAWKRKKSLASKISSNSFDKIYEEGINAGAWGGKILGAGGGGCMLFMASPDKMANIKEKVVALANKEGLIGFEELPFKFTECGVDIVYRDDRK